MSLTQPAKRFFVAAIVVGAGAIAFFYVLPRVMFHDIFEREKELTQGAVVLEAGRELAILCQTCRLHSEWFVNKSFVVPAWTPAVILRLDPRWIEITPDNATVEFGGGFHHCGYFVERGSTSKASDSGVTWVVYFNSEGSALRELCRFELSAAAVLTEDEYAKRLQNSQ